MNAISQKINNKLISIVFTAAISLIALFFVYGKGQDTNWDLLNYHFYTGYALLNGRFSIDVAAAGLQTFLNPLMNTISYSAYNYLRFPFSSWTITILQLLSVPAVVLILREVCKSFGYQKITSFEICALILCINSPLWWSEMGTSFFSSTTSPLILWSLYLLASIKPSTSWSFGSILFSGFLMGFAVGLKLTNAPFLLAACLALLVFCKSIKISKLMFYIIIFSSGSFLGFSITGWWNLYLYREWLSPLYPLYNGIFKSPYFKLENFRDMRWQFTSIYDFAAVTVQAASLTGRLSEVPFADIRYLLIGLILPGAFLCKPCKPFSQQSLFILIFVTLGYTLWAITTAYQRYVIPIELMLGVVILICIIRLCEKDWLKLFVMLLFSIISFYAMKIPDWGHIKKNKYDHNPFEIDIPDRIKNTPARYIVNGTPISYILPYLAKDSFFYGDDYAAGIVSGNNLVIQKIKKDLSRNPHLPLRIIYKHDNTNIVTDALNRYDLMPFKNKLNETLFKTYGGIYVISEMSSEESLDNRLKLLLALNFKNQMPTESDGIKKISGLSKPEPWGCWSEGNTVQIAFDRILPRGKILIQVEAHAYGPNIGKPFTFTFGRKEGKAIFYEKSNYVDIETSVEDESINSLKISIPFPISPAEIGKSSDRRKLGLGITSINIFLQR